MISKLDFAWYVLRVTYGREMHLKEHLDALGFETFIPLHYKERIRNGVLERRLEPVVHNLLFVFGMQSQLDELKPEMEHKYPFRFILNRATRKPIVIHEKEMRHFIAVAGSSEEQHLYLEGVDSSQFTKGDRVRVISGPFLGLEGHFIRIKGDRRVVISINGLMTVATTFIHPSLVEKIEG